eukprot:CAMPEP_0170186486 /NCGR_PEP_ID=MMETSP0040_2-20121228/39280_1 /TAXON_ID=641309 /ORGANISM="Lotharella oceanica, Strain CCMP622" /LENGTH=71 /DNA_ID=CAMNT_0010433245 /DNA_START=66 /DNA_END=282 /DNA_ORIENTATION=+
MCIITGQPSEADDSQLSASNPEFQAGGKPSHVLSAVVRERVDQGIGQPNEDVVVLVVAVPCGHVHEVGFLS